MSGQPRWTFYLVTLRRRRKFSVGNPKSDFTNWCELSWTRTWICFRATRPENISANCREGRRQSCQPTRKAFGAAASVRVDADRIVCITILSHHEWRRVCSGHRVGRDEAGNSSGEGHVYDRYCGADSHNVVQLYDVARAHPDAY